MIPLIFNYLIAFVVAVVLTAALVAIFLIFNALGKSIMEDWSTESSNGFDDDTDDPRANEDND